MAHLYLSDTLQADDCQPGALVHLGGTEARHAVTVSRIHAGERLLLGNGAGLMLEGTVDSVQTGAAAQLTLRVLTVTQTPRPAPGIRLVQALAKGDRDEMAVQAATELGIDGIVPWLAARSVSRWEGAKIRKGQDRWGAIVREAGKQSLRAWLPEVAELSTTRQLARLAGSSRMLLLEPTALLRLTELTDLADLADRTGQTEGGDAPFLGEAREIVLVVGPEGGISPAELTLLGDAGATAVRLGDTVLRTSTAGPAALAVLNAMLGRW
ncbi:MAG: 16S rRNA (uracil(1498)-N(3))-methyltransferase [Cryobacterium sp.]